MLKQKIENDISATVSNTYSKNDKRKPQYVICLAKHELHSFKRTVIILEQLKHPITGFQVDSKKKKYLKNDNLLWSFTVQDFQIPVVFINNMFSAVMLIFRLDLYFKFNKRLLLVQVSQIILQETNYQVKEKSS